MPPTAPALSLPERITAHMKTQPRKRFRPSEVADALPSPKGTDTARWRQKISNEMARMARNDTLLRGRVTDNVMGPGVYYWIPTGKQAPKPPHRAVTVTVTCTCGRTFTTQQKFREHQEKNKP